MPLIESSPALLLLVGALAYLLGSVPFGIVMARLFGLGDLRAIGSGNIGATNVLRTGHRLAAALTLIGDAGKGGAAVLAARALVGEDAAQIAGLAAFLGHLFPIFLQFQGGKGVATFLGVLLALAWPVGLSACATWLAVAALFRYSSLSALGAALSAPIWALMLDRQGVVILCIVLAALVFGTHRSNIRRLATGTEPRIGKSRS
ncbi:MAG: glycerol-3-phosphate 1-O-acyltransferase PlsY [Pseudomonadota bacterium]